MLVHVLPPSWDKRPGLPPVRILFTSTGSTRIWLKYMGRSSQLLMKFHVLPPSSERNMPLPLGLGGGGAPRPRPPPPPPKSTLLPAAGVQVPCPASAPPPRPPAAFAPSTLCTPVRGL